ncbi:MAG: MlaC/ttg2D family ABC transporter substrate-binding protein [Stenotrophobium sp.]
MNKTKKWLSSLICAMAFTFSVQAAAPAAPIAPDDTIKIAVNNLQDLLQKNHEKYQADKALFYKAVDDAVTPVFDLPYIAQLVLARHWRTATPDQRSKFQAAFKDMLIRSYANALLEYYSSVKVDWLPVHMDAGATDTTVNSRLLRDGKQPIAIGFSTHLVSGTWRVYDISIENISLVTNFRAQFNSDLKRNSLDDVIQRMENGEYIKAKTGGKD